MKKIHRTTICPICKTIQKIGENCECCSYPIKKPTTIKAINVSSKTNLDLLPKVDKES